MRWVPPAWVVRPAMRFRHRLGRAHAAIVPPQLLLMERMNGMVEAKMLSVFAELGIADLLGERSVPEIAAAAGVDADALDRLLGFLAARGLVGRTRGGRYVNNAVSAVLRSDHPESVRDWVRFFASDWHWEMWNHAGHSVATGDGASEVAFGLPFFKYLTTSNPSAGETFNRALQGMSALGGPMVAGAVDFSDTKRLCDVGGGTGGMLAAVLEQHPHIHGVLFDLPAVVDQARSLFATRGLLDRVDLIGGSFFDAVPSGCDTYMMQAVIHDWDDESCVTILRKCAEAVPPGGRVLVIENVLGTEPSPMDQFARSFDLVMLVTSGRGRERTEAQFSALFQRAGLQRRSDITLPSLFHVLELVKAP